MAKITKEAFIVELKDVLEIEDEEQELNLETNLKDLEGINKEKESGRISHTIGGRKRKLMLEKAKELGIRILNP